MHETRTPISPESSLAIRRRLVQALKDAGLGRLIGTENIQITCEGLELSVIPFNQTSVFQCLNQSATNCKTGFWTDECSRFVHSGPPGRFRDGSAI